MTSPIAKRYNGRQRCPHCQAPAKIRTSNTISPTYSEIHLRCEGEDDCGWRGVASIIIDRTTAQSRNPNPRIHLPLTAPRRYSTGQPVPANDHGDLAAAL